MPWQRLYLYQKYELNLFFEFHFISLCVVTCFWARYLGFCYRIIEGLRLEENSWGHLMQPPYSGSPRASFPEQCPAGFWISPSKMGDSTNCSSAQSPDIEESVSWCSNSISCLCLLPLCAVTGDRWKEPGSLLCTSSLLDIYTNW